MFTRETFIVRVTEDAPGCDAERGSNQPLSTRADGTDAGAGVCKRRTLSSA